MRNLHVWAVPPLSFCHYFPIFFIYPAPFALHSTVILILFPTSPGCPCSIIVINWLTALIDPTNPSPRSNVYFLNESLYIQWPCQAVSCPPIRGLRQMNPIQTTSLCSKPTVSGAKPLWMTLTPMMTSPFTAASCCSADAVATLPFFIWTISRMKWCIVLILKFHYAMLSHIIGYSRITSTATNCYEITVAAQNATQWLGGKAHAIFKQGKWLSLFH